MQEPVNDDTRQWATPLVIVPKRNYDEIRLCVDMAQAIKQPKGVILTLNELPYDLNRAKVFSKLDLNKGFHELEHIEDFADLIQG